tara:strand:+ start:156 stop:641 length:486 start_codon:yes stop_codon:yes gene_type:complete
MGLDMYLDSHHYYGGKYKNDNADKEYFQHTLEVSGNFAKERGIDKNNIAEIVLNVAYWRKANAIHGWFVTNVQDGVDDCKRAYCSPKQLKELVSICKETLKALDDEDYSLALELLPPTEGFFFGDYDVTHDWYRQEIEETIKQVELALDKPGDTFYYTSSW